jgi:hypothetical protein
LSGIPCITTIVRFRARVVSNVDPVLVPLHKSLFVDHRSLWNEIHRTVGRAQVLSNTKLANDKLVNFHARFLKGPGDYIDSCLKRLSGDNCIDLIMYQVDDFHSFRQLMHEPIDRPDHEVGSRTAHTHPDSAFIYATVLEGAIRSKINNGPEKVYRAGESWAEVPCDRHAVSANASDTQAARLLAVFMWIPTKRN